MKAETQSRMFGTKSNKINYHTSLNKWLFNKQTIGLWFIAGLTLYAIAYFTLIKNGARLTDLPLKAITAISSLLILLYLKLKKIEHINHASEHSKYNFFFPQRLLLFKGKKNSTVKLSENETATLNDEFTNAQHLHGIFLKQVSFLFLSYLLLYLWLVIPALINKSNPDREWFKIISFTLNNLGCWSIFNCFSTLYIPSKRTHPKITLSNLSNFSLLLILSLTFIYALSLLKPSNKTIFNSNEIGIISADSIKKDTLKIYDKPIYIQKLEEIDKGDVTIQTFKKKDSQHILKLKALYEIGSDTNHLTMTELKLAFKIPPFLSYNVIHLQDYIYLQKGSTKSKMSNDIQMRYRDTSKAYVDTSGDTATLYIPPLTSDCFVITELNIGFNKKYLKDEEAISFPSYVKLYVKKDKKPINMLFDAISGLINALVFALLIGRLDSRFIGLGKIWIALLFLYPAIQPLYIAFNPDTPLNKTMASIVIFTALILKLLLWLVVIYIAKSGRLFTYFFCLSELDKKADAVYENQLEIVITFNEHHRDYTFIVNNKNKKILHCNKSFKTLEKCKKFTEHFQQEIDKATINAEEKYPNLSYIIQFNELIYSKDLTEKDSEQFLLELKEKLPFCKVRISI